MNIRLLLLLLLTGILITACGDDEEPETCQTTDLTYTNGISAILSNSCATPGCHNSDTATTFPMGNYQEALAAVGFGRIIGAINHEDGFLPMPYPAGSDKLGECDIDKLTAWINNGAPE